MFTVLLRAAGAAIAIGAVLIVAAVQLDRGTGRASDPHLQFPLMDGPDLFVAPDAADAGRRGTS